MRYRHDPYAYNIRHTARGHGIARFMAVASLCVIGVLALTGHTLRASAEDGRVSYVAPADAQPGYATYHGYRIYYRHHRRYYLDNGRRHYLPRGRFAS